MENVILVCLLVTAGVFITLAIKMLQEVRKRGIKISIFWLRLYLFKYMHEYKKMTKEETGKVGPLFYPSIFFINMTLILAVTYALMQ